jgi:hypothetical protein
METTKKINYLQKLLKTYGNLSGKWIDTKIKKDRRVCEFEYPDGRKTQTVKIRERTILVIKTKKDLGKLKKKKAIGTICWEDRIKTIPLKEIDNEIEKYKDKINKIFKERQYEKVRN